MKTDVDEARPGHLGLTQSAQLSVREHRVGDIEGRTAQPAGQRDRPVGLEVGVPGPVQHRVDRLAGDGGEGGRQAVAEIVLK
jgi:hypothetical protein